MWPAALIACADVDKAPDETGCTAPDETDEEVEADVVVESAARELSVVQVEGPVVAVLLYGEPRWELRDPSSATWAEVPTPDPTFDEGVAIARSGGDLDGDGTADVVLGWRGGTSDAIEVFPEPTRADLGASYRLEAFHAENDLGTGLGYELAFSNDTLVIAQPWVNGDRGEIRTFDGGERTLDDAPCVVREPSSYSLGWGLERLGDVDGDGVEEMLVTDLGNGLWLWGGTSIADCTFDDALLMEAPLFDTGANYPNGAGVGDVDGDGLPDFAIGVPHLNQAGEVGVYHAGEAEPFTTITSQRWYLFGSDIAPAGDVDGDGRAEFFVGAADPFGADKSGVVFRVPGGLCGGELAEDIATLYSIPADVIEEVEVGIGEWVASAEGEWMVSLSTSEETTDVGVFLF